MSDCIYYRWNSGYYCDLKYDQTGNGDIDGDRARYYCWNGRYEDCPHWKQKQGSGGCFLTSACVNAKNLPDDCMELEILRRFRDEYLRKLPGGEEEIAEYYTIAPSIVAAINACTNSSAIWESIYNSLIMPCVNFITGGRNEAAHALYRKTVLELKTLYLG